MPTAEEIQREAFNDFEHWQSLQMGHVLDMDLIQQAAMYAEDRDYHDRVSDSAYIYRNN
jgi:hypothetical protein